jgi:farnesyl diphosphate synthase
VSELDTAMVAVAAQVDAELDRLLPSIDGPLGQLAEAMRYAALNGGKRFRPVLVAATARLGSAEPDAIARMGAAIEMVHAYSLVHDDLPAMDDASLRRGRPSCHRAFGEAVAILAGDALLTLAFEVVARDDWPCAPGLRCRLAVELGRAAGAAGMCGGQLLDLADAGMAGDPERITFVESLKTGAMIAFACEAGGLLAVLDESVLASVAAYARDLGLAFQIKDDLLDAEGDAALTGKDVGLDAAQGKATLVGTLGIEGARARLGELRTRALGHLDKFGTEATLMRDLFAYVINRHA